MSKLSFRARALDPSKPMPIYLAEELPDLPEYSAINRAVPQMPSGMEKEEESEHHLQRAICAGLIIPTPEVFTIDEEFYDRNYPPSFKMPRQMIHMQPLGLEQDIPDYDMDSSDEQWVSSQMHRLDLSPLKFEQMMDRLEKSSGQTVVTLNEAKALLKQDDEVSIAVYDYWLNKRLKTQHPLILSVKTESRSGLSTNNPYLAFRRRTEKMQTRKNRKNDETSYEKMLKLRRELNRAVTLLEMVKRREKTKREQLHLSIEIFEKRYQIRDFNGSIQAELSSNIKRPAFTPLYTNQYSHHSSLTQMGLVTTSSSSLGNHHYSSSQYLNSGNVATSSTTGNKRDYDSGSKKEKRQYKKRKHKRDKQFTNQTVSPAAIESTLSSDEDDVVGNHLVGSEGEDEGIYAFRRNKNCEYHKPLIKEYGNWPWASKEEYGAADPKYRFNLTSIRHPRPQCIGFARRRLGRGGRVILDRLSTDMDNLWSKLDYKLNENRRTLLKYENQEDDENISRDPEYLSSSTDLIPKISRQNNILRQNHTNILINDINAPVLSTTTTTTTTTTTNTEKYGINRLNNIILNKDIKTEIINIDDTEIVLDKQIQQQNELNQLKSNDLIKITQYKNNNNNNNINNNVNNHHIKNNISENIRTILNKSNNIDKNNVINCENNILIKEKLLNDNNSFDDENINLASLSNYISSTSTKSLIETNDDLKMIKNEILDDNNIDITEITNSNYINNYNKLTLNSILHENKICDNLNKSFTTTTTTTTSSSINLLNDQENNTIINNNDNYNYNKLLNDINNSWLHFRPKTPTNDDDDFNDLINNKCVNFNEQSKICIEIQKLQQSPPSSVFINNDNNQNNSIYITPLFSYNDLIYDEQIINNNNLIDNNINTINEFNLSGDSLNDLNLSLGEDDNENILDNILQECQIDDLKSLNQTTNFWNGILDDGVILDVIDDKKTNITIDSNNKERIGYNTTSELLINNNSTLNDDKDYKKMNKKKFNNYHLRIGNSNFSLKNLTQNDKFFYNNENKLQQQQHENNEEILLTDNIISTTIKDNYNKNKINDINNTIDITKNKISINILSPTKKININKPNIYNIKQELIGTTQTTNLNKQNSIITLSTKTTNNNNKLDNDIGINNIIKNIGNNTLINDTIGGHVGGLIVDGGTSLSGIVIKGTGSLGTTTTTTTAAVQQPTYITTKQQTNIGLQQNLPTSQHIIVQQIAGGQSQIINPTNASINVNDLTGNILLTTNNPIKKQQINGPTDKNAIQNLLKQTKFINRKIQLTHTPLQNIKQEEDNTITGNYKTNTGTHIQSAGNFIKMSAYPVVVTDLNTQTQNTTLSASAVAVASNHNYSLQPSSAPITIIGQQQQGNKIILNTTGTSGTLGVGGNFTISTPIQDIQNKIPFNQLHSSNIKVNLVTSTGIQQGSIIVDNKNNTDIIKTSTALHSSSNQQQQQQHSGSVQMQHPQQRIKLDKALNMYIDPEHKRVLYTKLVNLASLQQKTNSVGQSQQTTTLQVNPNTTQLLNKTHTVQRIANAQAIVNMRNITGHNQILTTSGTGVNSINPNGNDVSLKQQNNSTHDTLSTTTLSSGININTTNR